MLYAFYNFRTVLFYHRRRLSLFYNHLFRLGASKAFVLQIHLSFNSIFIVSFRFHISVALVPLSFHFAFNNLLLVAVCYSFPYGCFPSDVVLSASFSLRTRTVVLLPSSTVSVICSYPTIFHFPLVFIGFSVLTQKW